MLNVHNLKRPGGAAASATQPRAMACSSEVKRECGAQPESINILRNGACETNGAWQAGIFSVGSKPILVPNLRTFRALRVRRNPAGATAALIQMRNQAAAAISLAARATLVGRLREVSRLCAKTRRPWKPITIITTGRRVDEKIMSRALFVSANSTVESDGKKSTAEGGALVSIDAQSG